MTIAGVVSRGFGNGTYDPGVAFLPTRGYMISLVTAIAGPGCWAAGQVYLPSFKEGELFSADFKAGELFSPDFKAGQVVCN